ncbi:MAG: hypothetical protein IPK82_31995 [Polyangiaceae bacterium]|nr:hypothetical protein [Polyangiaceae bacterium]
MTRGLGLVAMALLCATVGCAAQSSEAFQPRRPDLPTHDERARLNGDRRSAKERFETALAEMAVHDKAPGWTQQACSEIAEKFIDAATAGGSDLYTRALFNAGIAYERCADDGKAKELFDRVLAASPTFYQAKVHLILIEHRGRGGKNIDDTIAALRQTAVVEAQYKSVEGLVNLAMLSLQRDGDNADNDGKNDRARALRYLQSALAVDDNFTPAMNGLALYYLSEARHSGGDAASNAESQGTQAMELASLVCAQAIRKDPQDALMYNTQGLIFVELKQYGKAAEAFGKARSLRPGFYEAEMNFAAVNLEFRGFVRAEESYRAVLKQRPADYDALIGLALAIRGQINDTNADKMIGEAEKYLSKAREIEPNRPEAYYNQAVLTQEYKARGDWAEAQKQLDKATAFYKEFIRLAGTSKEYAKAVELAKGRLLDIDQVRNFVGPDTKKGS